MKGAPPPSISQNKPAVIKVVVKAVKVGIVAALMALVFVTEGSVYPSPH